MDDDDLSRLIDKHATRHTAPGSALASVRAQVAMLEAGRTVTPTSRRRWWIVPWVTAGLSFALGVAATTLVLPLVQQMAQTTAPQTELLSELVADHVRALQIGPLIEVASSDRHTVKPWFQGRVDYAPPVFDFSAEGFPLSGGRIEHVRGNAIATLAYARNHHVITVFVWPSAAQQAPARSQRRGFNAVQWADGAMQYWAISDMERTEMDRFAQLWVVRVTAQ